jgi:hypothetical protein
MEREWRSIVGDALADRSAPRMFEDGVLVVTVAGQSALQDLNFRKGAIRSAILNRASLEIKDIRAEIGRVNARPPRRSKSAPLAPCVPRRLGDAEGERIGEACANIMSRHSGLDPELVMRIARCRVMRGE